MREGVKKTSLENFEPFDFLDCEIEKTDGLCSLKNFKPRKNMVIW